MHRKRSQGALGDAFQLDPGTRSGPEVKERITLFGVETVGLINLLMNARSGLTSARR